MRCKIGTTCPAFCNVVIVQPFRLRYGQTLVSLCSPWMVGCSGLLSFLFFYLKLKFQRGHGRILVQLLGGAAGYGSKLFAGVRCSFEIIRSYNSGTLLFPIVNSHSLTFCSIVNHQLSFKRILISYFFLGFSFGSCNYVLPWGCIK